MEIFSSGSGYKSPAIGSRVPEACSTINCAARKAACNVPSGSTCLPNLSLASVLNFSTCEVRLLLRNSKFADSSKIFVVVSETSESLPPMTPAIAISPELSVIMSISSSNFRSTSSSVSSVSPFTARRTIIFGVCPLERSISLSWSKACKGCPSSNIT